MTPPQRPRSPQPGRTSGPQRPVPPRPAPPRAEPARSEPARAEPAGPGDGRPATPANGRPATPRRSGAPTAGARTAGGRTSARPAGDDAAAPRSSRSTPAATAGHRTPTGSTRATEQPGRATGSGSTGTARRTTGTAVEPRTGAFPVRPPVVSQGSAARFAERARARRRLAWRQILIASGSVLAIGAVAWALLFSPLLALDTEQVEVTGAGTVVAVDQVREVVDAEAGMPLTRLDTTGLRSALLDVPGVRDVTVTRDWPHGLSVRLVSREPVAAVPESADVAAVAEGDDGGDGGYALVDQDGVKVGRVDAPPEGLPVVDVPVGQARILSAALGVLHSLPEDLLADIGQVSAGTQDTVEFVLRDGARVEWGSAQDASLKAAVLKALRAAPETAGSERYDVSAPTMPVVG